MKIATKKLHLQNPLQSSNEAIITQIHPRNGIVTDATVAFSESGGQEGDKGIIRILESNQRVPFSNTKKGVGETVFLKDFPSIQVRTPVYHLVAIEDLEKFKIGQKVLIEIDLERREKLTISHTAIHLALMGLETLFPDIYGRIKGCHIKEESARLDFHVKEKMTEEDFNIASSYANNLIEENHEILTYPHKDESEAYYWQLKSTIYACGGTHLARTGQLRNIHLNKKNLGKNAQRLVVTFPKAKVLTDRYN